MLMLRALNAVPVWLVLLLVVGTLELYSIGLMLLTRRKYGPDRLKPNNEVAGYKFAVIGVLYAVLLAFVVIAVWENYSSTEGAIRAEAKAVGGLTQLSYALPEEKGKAVRDAVTEYADQVRRSEWATMARGETSTPTSHALAHLTETVFDLPAEQIRDLALFQQSLRLIAVIEDNRNERLDSANGSVPAILWFVMIAGAMITLGYPAFFGTTNVVAQTLMTGLLAGLVGLTLLLALVLDFPFTGQVSVSSIAFDEALQQMAPHLKGHAPPGIAPSP